MTISIPDRFEALGPRGEACIIERHDVTLANGTRQPRHALATGERLRVTDDPTVFETLDGQRSFRLRPPDAGMGLAARLAKTPAGQGLRR